MTDRVVPVRIPANLFDLMEEHRKQRNAKAKGEHFTRSAWIRDAIREKINHALRSKNKGKGKVFTCRLCGFTKPQAFIGFSEKLLTGKTEHTCKCCELYKVEKKQTPVLDHGSSSNGENPSVPG